MTRYESKMTISEVQLLNMLSDDVYKDSLKKQLAYELSKTIIGSKNPTFTYTKNPQDFTSTIKIVVDL